MNEKQIIAVRNAMKSKWQRSEEEKEYLFHLRSDRKRIHFNLVTWESISQLDTSLVIEIHHKPYAVECWASDNNDWCLHSDPKTMTKYQLRIINTKLTNVFAWIKIYETHRKTVKNYQLSSQWNDEQRS